MSPFVKVAKVADFSPANCKHVEIEDKGISVGLFSIDGKIYAMDGTCPHLGGPLGEGSLDGNVVSCPWHGWTFDVMTGSCRARPGVKLATYDVKTEGEDIFVNLP
ncbi:MAG: hypothetical protein A2036_00105 [Omnitrophica bacterium GWA2_50_21]|nr:MAG: hypothetical protein A2036_00105 [Omnitrophica bacterium GWA2_50_21]